MKRSTHQPKRQWTAGIAASLMAVVWLGTWINRPLAAQELLPPPKSTRVQPTEPSAIPTTVRPGNFSNAPRVRIKDITYVEGQRVNRFTGIGLVTGLNGTGGNTPKTRELTLAFFERLGGIRSDPQERDGIGLNTQFRTNNVSVVAVTAEVPVNRHRIGNRIDVIVSTLDDATSLLGGHLELVSLQGFDGEIYAVASGVITNGGFSFSGDAASVQKNHATTGRVPGGAIIEKDICKPPFAENGFFILNLEDPDLETASRIAREINKYWPHVAQILRDDRIKIFVPPSLRNDAEQFAAQVEGIYVQPDVAAKVVINERTGTVVVGEHVKISPVAITHANLTVITGESPIASQPAPFSDGETVVLPRTDIEVTEEQRAVSVLEPTVTVGELARALNSLGVTPRDLSSIFQSLKQMGALHAKLEFQ